VLTVRDTGRGMDGPTLERATEPFFTTKPEGSGTGLGLSSVAAFAAAAGGYMKLDSEPGAGTAVSLHLPRAPEVAETAAEQNSNAPRGGGELVLVVDDDASVREITMQRLEALGYAVEEAPDASSALRALHATEDFALVLSDINMPGPMNGLALRDRLAAEMPHIPVVLITAHEEMAGGAGQRQILSKFCSQLTLAQALASALASTLGTRGGSNPVQEETQETGAART
jgi:CheY-like chemotaxis protein